MILFNFFFFFFVHAYNVSSRVWPSFCSLILDLVMLLDLLFLNKQTSPAKATDKLKKNQPQLEQKKLNCIRASCAM